ISAAVAGYVRTLGVADNSASLSFVVGYARGSLEGDLLGEHVNTPRSGLADPRVRLAVNLLGNPALTMREFARTPTPPFTLGASLIVILPLGQYNSERLINVGSNRWGFNPELGSRWTIKRWTLETD